MNIYTNTNTLRKPNGDYRHYGPDGRADVDTDYSHPQHHPELPNPHSHDWNWDKDGNPQRGPAYDPDKKKEDNSDDVAKYVIGGIGVGVGGYLIYRGIRLLPSLFPPLWWSLPVNVVTP